MSEQRYLITTGNNFEIALNARRNLLPEYQVLYGGFDIISALKELPLILSGNQPPGNSLHTHIGTNDFSKKPNAVVLGGGYNDEATDALFSACLEACRENGISLDVPFLRNSKNISDEQLAKGSFSSRRSSEYAAVAAQRLKDKLEQVKRGAVTPEEGDREGLYFF